MCTLSYMRNTYPTDLSGEEWGCLKTCLPASKLPHRLLAHFLRGDICTECVCIITSMTSFATGR